MSPPLMLTREQSRQVDRIANDEYGIPGVVLMENAGRGVVEALLEVDSGLAESPGAGRERGEPLVVILCGKGKNAGDGFVIARHLEIRGVRARVVLLGAPADLAGDARTNYDILARAGADIVNLSSDAAPIALVEQLDRHAGGAAWLVDAMLGTGAVGPVREPFRTAIQWMNSQPARRLAVDIPSGLDCDTGEAPGGVAVRADVTCTFVAPKPGLVAPPAAQYVGKLRMISIGAPLQIVERAVRS